MRRPTLLVAALSAVALGLAACSADVDVATERSDRIGSAPPPVPPASPSEPATQTTDTIDWSDCSEFGIPPDEQLGTARWECATLDVPMDPFGDSAELDNVELALTRHAATGDRRGALLVNPGGPGGPGLEFAWGLRGGLPASLLRSFDIVSWDPRGVGRSRPAISCGDDPDFDAGDLMFVCAEATGEIAAFLAAPYVAADMEAIREALGEEQLDYLGYSYGTALGASYAAQFPDRVGRFVFDGATSPLIGGPDGPFEDGFPYYADDGLPAASARFEDLCDATDRCALGDDSTATLDALSFEISSLPTDNFDFAPEFVAEDVFVESLASSMSYSADWELLATALSDAAAGDASAMASWVSVDPGVSSDALGEPTTAFELANLVIYCADFAHVITEWTYCDGIPANEAPLVPVVEVDVDLPILVVGTVFDPSTPGKYAPEFAAALGDAVAISWNGVGHTAFPAPTRCINDAVVDYLVGAVLPPAGLECSFLEGVDDDAALADELFGHGDLESEGWLVDSFSSQFGLGTSAAQCAARSVNEMEDRVISHVILGVTSDDAQFASGAAIAAC